MPSSNLELIDASPVEAFFHDQVHDAISHQNVKVSIHTEYYLVRLLSDFSRFEAECSEKNLQTPLAILYLESLQSSRFKAARLLKQIGDLALYLSGFFSESLSRKSVDLDYYIAMGGNAYHRLHHLRNFSEQGRAFSETFFDLAKNFICYMDLLGEVSERLRLRKDSDLLRLYERWTLTGSERLRRKLESFGINTTTRFSKEQAH